MSRLSAAGVFLMLVMMFLTLPAEATWAPAGLQGEDVTALAEDPGEAAIWYAGTSTVVANAVAGDIYKYEDATGWVLASTGLPTDYGVLSLAVDPAVSNTIYAGLDGAGAYKSVDGGASWTASGLSGLSVRDIAVDAYDPSILFSATDNGIYKSVDAGVNWTAVVSAAVDTDDIKKMALNPPDFTLNPLPSQTDIVYAAGTGGIYKSVDAGSTWSRLDTEGSGITTLNFSTLAIDPTRPDILFAGTSDAGLYRSADGGAAWAATGAGVVGQSITAVEAYPGSGNPILAGTEASGVFRSTNDGASWAAWNTGITTARSNTMPFIVPQHSYALAGTADGVFSYDISAEPDFVVSALSSPTTVRTREVLSIDSTVATLAGGFAGYRYEYLAPTYYYSGTYSDGIGVDFYLSADTTLDAGDIYMTRRGVYNMDPLGSNAATTTYTVPHTVPEGTYYLMAKVWTFGDVSEADRTNNIYVGNQISVIEPDFVVMALSSQQTTIMTREVLSIDSTVATLAGGFAGYRYEYQAPTYYYSGTYSDGIGVDFYLSADTTLDAGDIYMTRRGVYNMDPLGSNAATTTYTVPHTVPEGTYYLMAKVWTFGDVSEADGTNNIYVGNQVSVIGPDLTVAYLDGPTIIELEDTITVDNTINTLAGGFAGYRYEYQAPTYYYSGPYSDGIAVDFYLSADGVLGDGTGEYYLGRRGIYSMDPLGSNTESTVLTLPASVTAGTYYLAAKVWTFGDVAESDPTNNTLVFGPVYVGNRPPVANAIVGSTECTSPDGTPVTLSAENSYDPDGDPVTIEWSEGGVALANTITYTTEPLALDSTHTYTLTITDDKGLWDSVDVTFTVSDTTAPTTTSSLSGTMGDNNWWVSDVDVELTATDTCSGVATLHYTVTGPGHDGSETIIQGDTDNINLNADGSYTVTYWAVDNAGNVEVVAEVPVHREYNPPTVETGVTPTGGDEPVNNYYHACVTVHLATTDSASGEAVTEYWDPVAEEWLPYNEAVGIPVCATRTVEYRSTSPAGNVHENTITINIDQTPPVITVLNVTDGEVYELGLFNSPGYTATDAGSGVASSTDTLTGGDGLGLGQFTYSVTATDVANNSDTVTIHFEVIGSIDGLQALVADYTASGDIDSSITGELLADLDNAENAATENEEDGYLQAFIGKVYAQSGKKVTASVADILVHAAEYVIANN